MREIKFKTWDSGRGEWLQKHPFALYGETTLMGLHDRRESDDSRVKCEELKNLIPCQYTGLKDKNGKEIYEGDILKMDSEEDQSTFEVVWKFNGWRKKFTDWPDDLPEYNLLSRGDLGFYKIIGNIYENPELLERP